MSSELLDSASRQPESSRPMLAGGFVISLLLLATVGAVSSLPATGAESRQPVAIVFPPWVSNADAAGRSFAAGYRVLRPGRAGSIVIVAPPAAGDALAARPAGALLLASLSGLGGCLDAAKPLDAAVSIRTAVPAEPTQ